MRLVRVAAAFALLAATTLAVRAETVTVFAAASLKNALDDAARAFTARTGTEVRTSYAASSALAKQIESGAPADLFASADTQWMDELVGKKLVQPGTRVDLLGNDLVAVAPSSSDIEALALTPEGWSKAVGDGKWTTGTVNAVPVGIYAKAALTRLGLWKVAEPKLAQAPDVRAALAFVARGEAPLGVVYRTDANAEKAVKVVAIFPPDSHEPIVYSFALTVAAKGPSPAALLDYLRSADARPFFERQGFVVLRR